MIEVINKFWELDKQAKFTHLEVHLFFKLLDLNSKLNKEESLLILSSHLQKIVHTKAKGLVKARQRLIDFKLIEIEKGSTRKPTAYKILYLPKETNQDLYLLKETNPKGFDLSFVSIEFKPLVDEFIRYRKQDLNLPFKTVRGILTFYNELQKLSNGSYETAKELIDHAIKREWRSVYPIKKGKQERKPYRNSDIEVYTPGL